MWNRLVRVVSEGPWPGVWQEWRPALLALVVVLAVRLVGRIGRRPALAAQAVPVGALVGWTVLLGGRWDSYWSWDEKLPQRLPVLAVLALVISVTMLSARRAASFVPVIAGGLGGWWLTGAPHDKVAVLHGLPHWAVIGALIAGTIWVARHSSPWTPSACALGMWGGLRVLGMAGTWPLAALCVAAGSAGMLGRSAASEGGAGGNTGAIITTAFLAGALELAYGHVLVGGFAAGDLVGLTPLAMALVAPRLGRGDPVLGNLLAGLLCMVMIGGAAIILTLQR